ncbi:hypothetical protein BN14_08096 [Rhizoctonia solani AG-1 IB]|uniref:MACPF-like domain-containing protein n=1 Tax=Thanatephorus cucumeris (strain AG1-IB / isolate 7/3/14) TaxID=1108050 RepID=M5C4N9_THACB|nr:hypothetical protein BN14_08096 [Rhizoctonia solani AG-1 IB]
MDNKFKQSISIMKGPSISHVRPFVTLYVSDKVKTLEDLREMLRRFKYISSTEAFLDISLFPIHKEDEADHKWSDIVIDSLNMASQQGRGAKIHKTRGESEQQVSLSNSLAIDFPAPSVVIVSRPSDWGPVPPNMEHGKPDSSLEEVNQAKSRKSNQPTDGSSNIPNPVNVKILNKEQLDEVFEINNVFGGVSGLGVPGATNKIFESPRDLSQYIWPYDDSNVEIVSTSVEGEAHMMKKGSFTAGIDASFKWLGFQASISNSKTSEWSVSEKETEVIGIYRYPRAVIRLPLAILNPTETFRNELAAALADSWDMGLRKRRLASFFQDYGQFFASEVYLGGHLHTSKKTQYEKKEERETKIQDASASIQSGMAIPFGLKLNMEYSKEETNERKRIMEASQLLVEAVGGDTLLSSDLPRWCASVLPHENWRITKRSEMKLLIDIPSLVSLEQKNEIAKILGLEPVTSA